MLKAVKENGFILRLLNRDLQHDKDIVNMAIKSIYRNLDVECDI